MGMRKKWSRLITVDGVQYRYHIAEDQFGGCGLHICIQRVEPTGQRLMSGFRKPIAWSNVAPGHTVGRFEPQAVPPRVIRELILAGLAAGWRPSALGLGTFHLPGWQVVQRLTRPAEPGIVPDTSGM